MKIIQIIVIKKYTKKFIMKEKMIMTTKMKKTTKDLPNLEQKVVQKNLYIVKKQKRKKKNNLKRNILILKLIVNIMGKIKKDIKLKY